MLPHGVRQINPTGGATALFGAMTTDPAAVATFVKVAMAPEGLDISSFEGVCTPPQATIEVNTLNVSGESPTVLSRTNALENRLIEVNVHLGNCDGGLVDMSDGAVEPVLRDLTITFSFNTGLVHEGALESGAFTIYSAQTREDFIMGNVAVVNPADIVMVDYAMGRGRLPDKPPFCLQCRSPLRRGCLTNLLLRFRIRRPLLHWVFAGITGMDRVSVLGL